MNDRKQPEGEFEALHARISALSAASLRISASLDLDTVLDEVAQSARALTGARYSAIAITEEGGRPQDFVTSGLTPEEHRQLVEWPDGPRLFEHFRDLSGPLRIADMPGYLRSLGFSPHALPSKTFQGTPMRHLGAHVGSFYLIGKEGGGAFTEDDEEVLVLFRLAGRDRYRQRAHLPGRAARARRSGGPGRDLPGRRRGVRRRERRPGLAQPRGEAHRGKPVRAGPVRGAVDGDGHLPSGRRARTRAGSIAAGGGVAQRRDGARRGDGALGARRTPRDHARQRDPDPWRGRRGGLGGGRPAGPGAAPGAGSGCGRSSSAW